MTECTKFLAGAITIAVLASPAVAQTAPADPWATEAVVSRSLGVTRPVFVVTPDGYQSGSSKYPVLVILDANDRPQFSLAVANVAFLASRAAIPPMIVVGIPNVGDRTHDLTPTPTGKTAKDFPTAGGASAFESFLSDEVLPMIRAKYRTLPTTILAGHSFGGLVALDVAAQKPGIYQGIIAMSPALWWNDSSLVEAYATAMTRSRATQRVFVTSGGLEPDIDRPARAFVKRFETVKPVSVAVGYRGYADDTHGLTPASLADGLRFVFEPVSMANLPISKLNPSATSAQVVAAVMQTRTLYANGARQLGLPTTLPERELNELGYNIMQSLKSPGLAAWVFQQNVEMYPESANVYDSLGDALLAKGDTTAARTAFKRAADVATSQGRPVAEETRIKLAALDKAAAGRKTAK
ncbi:MAG TPA: alpha/beta hydrolase-fold protein [Gemmatimonadaceae bacterium]|nr:alpha/beta hydrolase-fold protein [Gemmatimonadaceae bacterium]